VRITRPRHPLQDKLLQVLGGMRRHGVVESLLVLPDGSKSLVPAAWKLAVLADRRLPTPTLPR
jgi:hypothetical protein